MFVGVDKAMSDKDVSAVTLVRGGEIIGWSRNHLPAPTGCLRVWDDMTGFRIKEVVGVGVYNHFALSSMSLIPKGCLNVIDHEELVPVVPMELELIHLNVPNGCLPVCWHEVL